MDYQSIYVYGAGFWGKQAAAFLRNKAFENYFKGVCVTDKAQNYPIENMPLYDLSDIKTSDKETLFIVAAAEPGRTEIRKKLEEHGYENMLNWPEDKYKLSTFWSYTFTDRRHHFNKALFVLSGYKPFLWPMVFRRIEKYADDDIDICMLSSGVYSDELERIADKNGWSYLSTETNDLTLIQNIGIVLHPHAEWIYKMDEDVFVTEGVFHELYSMHRKIDESEAEPYDCGFTAPLIPVNGYGYIQILDMLNLRRDYEGKYGKVLYGGKPNRTIENNGEAAAYMWGKGGYVPQLDNLNRVLPERPDYSVCPVRFSIGLILYKRSLYEEMGGWDYSGETDMGRDEEQICSYCMVQSRAIVVCNHAIAGHFSFGQQTNHMKKILLDEPELFSKEM